MDHDRLALIDSGAMESLFEDRMVMLWIQCSANQITVSKNRNCSQARSQSKTLSAFMEHLSRLNYDIVLGMDYIWKIQIRSEQRKNKEFSVKSFNLSISPASNE